MSQQGQTPLRLTDIRCFMLDMDGTFYLGDQLFPWSLGFIETLQKLGIDFLFLTNNSSKDRSLYAQKISRMGLQVSEEKVLTSGEATAIYMEEQYPGARLFVAGTPSLQDEFSSRNFKLDDQNPEAVVLGFDTTLTYQKLWKLCDFVRAGLPFIATHPDINCPTEQGFMPDIGAMLAAVTASTGRSPDIIIGKPNRMIAEAAARKLNLPLRSLAMVGDRLYTDIALGREAGITSILVLSGETKEEDLPGSPHQPDYTFTHLGKLAEHLNDLYQAG